MAKEKRATPRVESVVLELRNKILAGEFPPGFHVQEIPIAESLGVSRTPVHEALTILAQEGLLLPGPKRGFKVRTFTIGEVLDAYEVRANLEALAARLLAERGLQEQAKGILERCLEDGDRMLGKGMFGEKDQRPWLEMNNTFHTTLVDATQNTMLASFVEQSHKVPLASARHVHWYRFDKANFDLARRAHQAHHDIFDAISSGQVVRAESLMREHIYFSQRLIAENVGEPSIGFDTDLSAARKRAPDGRRK